MRCPTCAKPVEEPKPGRPGTFYPFCSERCKLIDLGRWLRGKYQIPAVESDDAAEPPADSAGGGSRGDERGT